MLVMLLPRCNQVVLLTNSQFKSSGNGRYKGLPLFFCLSSLFLSSCITPKVPDHLEWSVIDAHEHIQSEAAAAKLIRAMDRRGIGATILVASPEELFFDLQEHEVFAHPEINNAELLKISKVYPGRFYAFATFSPHDKKALEKLKEFIANGGHGLKLYNGHVAYHDSMGLTLNAPHIMELLAYCEKYRIPVVFHANARFYWDELKQVLDAFPHLIINLPHYCMALINFERMREIFNHYPNVYTDISLGHHEFAYPALVWISDRVKQYREFVIEYSDRFLFATDMVISNHPDNDQVYMENMLDAYRSFLEQKTHQSILIDYYLRDFGKGDEDTKLNGLDLDKATLKKIYMDNARRFLARN